MLHAVVTGIIWVALGILVVTSLALSAFGANLL